MGGARARQTALAVDATSLSATSLSATSLDATSLGMDAPESLGSGLPTGEGRGGVMRSAAMSRGVAGQGGVHARRRRRAAAASRVGTRTAAAGACAKAANEPASSKRASASTHISAVTSPVRPTTGLPTGVGRGWWGAEPRGDARDGAGVGGERGGGARVRNAR